MDVSVVNLSESQPTAVVGVLPAETGTEAKNEHSLGHFIKTGYQLFTSYLVKFRGLGQPRPKRSPWDECLWSFIGAFLGIAAVAFLHSKFFEPHQFALLVGSFGASAVILFATPSSPLAQPRNLIGGHFIGATCGCLLRLALARYEYSTTCALAVASAIVVMQLTETLHPPGGASALIAVTMQPALPWSHFMFIFVPALTGAFVMLAVALLVNNLAPKRTYPAFWW